MFNVVTGGRDAGATLVAHPGVAKIGFIGSVAAGRTVAAVAAATLKAVTLELGGKNALVACADTTPAEIADGVVRGMNFRYVTGQSCNSTSRVYLHADIHDAALVEIVRRVAALKVGLPTERDSRGRLPHEPGAVRQDDELHQARPRRRRAARLGREAPRRCRSSRAGSSSNRPCSPMSPTTCGSRARRSSDRSSRILRWSDEEDLLTRVNALDYGLTASIWTHDLDRAHRLASRIEAGYVWINGASTHHVGVPFGGVKQSGLGREESIEELLACTQIKNVNVTLRSSHR